MVKPIYNIHIVKKNGGTPTTNSKDLSRVNNPFFINPSNLIFSGEFKLSPKYGIEINMESNNSLNRIAQGAKIWKTLLPLPQGISEETVLEFLEKTMNVRQYSIGLRTDKSPFGENKELTDLFVDNGLLTKENKNLVFTEKYDELSNLLNEHIVVVPFTWDKIKETSSTGINKLLVQNITGGKANFYLDAAEDKYIVGVDNYVLDKATRVQGFIFNDQEKMVHVSSEFIQLSTRRLNKKYHHLAEDLKRILGEAANAKIVLKPYAITKSHVLFYAMECVTPVYVLVHRHSFNKLYNTYGDKLEFRINSFNSEIDNYRVNVFNGEQIVANIYPTVASVIRPNVTGSKSMKLDQFSITKQYLHYSKIFETVRLMSN